MKANVLIIEDIREMAELVALYLEKEGIETLICDTGESAIEAMKTEHYDLLLLDINLPGMDGFEFLQVLRRTSMIPVIIVSARESDEDIIMGLGIGADEFVTKPFSPKVLAARVRAQLRRAGDLSVPSKNLIRFGPYQLDTAGYILRKDSGKIALSSKEFEVLYYLISEAGRALTPDKIYGTVWKNQFGDLTVVAVYIQRLRKKIEVDPANPFYIQTIHGMGYRFNPDAIGAQEERAI
jgi:DNA-binding response OmpR family regulator